MTERELLGVIQDTLYELEGCGCCQTLTDVDAFDVIWRALERRDLARDQALADAAVDERREDDLRDIHDAYTIGYEDASTPYYEAYNDGRKAGYRIGYEHATKGVAPIYTDLEDDCE